MPVMLRSSAFRHWQWMIISRCVCACACACEWLFLGVCVCVCVCVRVAVCRWSAGIACKFWHVIVMFTACSYWTESVRLAHHCSCQVSPLVFNAVLTLVFTMVFRRDADVHSAYLLRTAKWLGGSLAVCHSRYCIKTTKTILKLFPPSGSPIIEAFRDPLRQ